MAIIFTKKKQNRNIFLTISFIIIGICLVFLGQMLLNKEIISFPVVSIPPTVQEVKINFDILEKMEEFQPFVLIQPLEKSTSTSPETGEVVDGLEAGRSNPFIPY